MISKDIVDTFEHRPEKDKEVSHTGAWRKDMPSTGNGYGKTTDWNVLDILQEQQ